MYRNIRMISAMAACALVLGGCAAATSPVPLAPAQPLAHLQSNDIEYLQPGTTLTLVDLKTGRTMEEDVIAHDGRLYQSHVRGRRSFYYIPDPWADNENTNVADMAPLFPLQVGNKAVFNRHPEIGKVTDTVEVTRAETLQLPMGAVDTFVIETESKATDGIWQGHATVWYAPSLHAVAQIVIKDNCGDDRQRQLVEIRKPGA
jgi:hypothetical protein